MRYTRQLSLIVLALLVSVLNVSTSVANVEPDNTDYRVRARVARISLMRGDVQLRRAGSREWESAAVNLPLVEGDQLATGRDARFEVQIDAYNFVRVDENSILSIVTLRDEGIALSLAEGTATVRLSRFDKDREYFEVDAPKTTMAAEKRGLYRLDAVRNGNSNGDVRITVRDGGRARIYSESSGFTLRDGRTARLFLDGTDAGDWELTSASSLDAWDEWVDEREEYLARRLNYDRRDHFYRSSLWGAEELDAYGEWTYAGSYGWVWRPHITVINNYYNWAPYRYGHWRWCPPYGWVWVGDEPWGWAPYHYGRWVFYNGNWCWTPYGYYDYARRLDYYHYWQPSLVVFVHIPSYHQVCWYPLPYHAPTPVYTGPVAQPGGGMLVEGPKGGQLIEQSKGTLRPQAGDKAYLNAVTSMPVKDFGAITPSAKPAPPALAQTVIQSEPVGVNNLPVKRPIIESGVGPIKNGVESSPVRPRGSGGLVAPTAERPTGAAIRKPGVALDKELRNSSLYNGREPIVKPSANDGNNGRNDGAIKDTGAVTRPSRPVGRPNIDRPVEKGDDSAPPVRPVRPDATIRGDDSEPESQPVRPSRKPDTRPEVTPPPQEMPDRSTRRPPSEPRRDPEPVRPERSRPEPPQLTPERPQRSEPPPQKYEPPPPSYEPPPSKSEPPPPPPPPPSKAPDAPVNSGKSGKG